MLFLVLGILYFPIGKRVCHSCYRARILPKQTKPMFIGKVRSIASFIGDQLQCSDLHCSLKERYTLLRDQAMLKLQFFAGDRASDISNILVQEVKEIPDKSGCL